MTGFLVIVLLLCLLKDGMSIATAWEDEDFFRYCPISRCSEHGPEIRFPFRLESNNTSSLCGASGLRLACSGQDTILFHPALASYIVSAIDYRGGTLTLVPRVDDSSPSCRQKLMSAALPHSTVDDRNSSPPLCYLECAVIVSYLTEFAPSNHTANYIFGPISCLSNASHFSYFVDGWAPVSMLPLDCKVLPDSFFLMPDDSTTFKEKAEGILNFSETTTGYYCSFDPYESLILHNCTQCELGGRGCGFSPQRNKTFCMNHGSHIKVIAATSSVAALVILLLMMVASALYFSLKKRYTRRYT